MSETEIVQDPNSVPVIEKGQEFLTAIVEWVKTYTWNPVEIGLIITVAVLAIIVIWILARRGSMRSDFRKMTAAFNEMKEQSTLQLTLLKEFGVVIDGVGKELEPETVLEIRESVKAKVLKIVGQLIGTNGAAREQLEAVVTPVVDRAIEGIPSNRAFEADVVAKVHEDGVVRAAYIISNKNKDGRTRKLFLTTVDDRTDEIIPIAVADDRFTEEVTEATINAAINRGCWLVSLENDGGEKTTRHKLEVDVSTRTRNDFIPAALRDSRFILAVGEEAVQQVILFGTEALKAREGSIGEEVASQVGSEVDRKTMEAIGAIRTLSGILSGSSGPAE